MVALQCNAMSMWCWKSEFLRKVPLKFQDKESLNMATHASHPASESFTWSPLPPAQGGVPGQEVTTTPECAVLSV